MRLIDADALEKTFFADCEHHKCDKWDISAIIAQINDAPTIMPPPNPPLTLDELREMDGDLVWIERSDGWANGWAIVGDVKSIYRIYFGTAKGGMRLPYDECGKTWLAYRRKPEEGTV